MFRSSNSKSNLNPKNLGQAGLKSWYALFQQQYPNVTFQMVSELATIFSIAAFISAIFRRSRVSHSFLKLIFEL